MYFPVSELGEISICFSSLVYQLHWDVLGMHSPTEVNISRRPCVSSALMISILESCHPQPPGFCCCLRAETRLLLLFETPWVAACQASLLSTLSQSFLRFMSTDSVMLSKYLILCHPLLLLPSIFPNIRVFSNESHQVFNVLEFQLQHHSFQSIFRTDFL